jgi:hypothetical protein
VEQRRVGDFDGAVETWIETELGNGIKPTRQERKRAKQNMRAFFDEH